MYSIKYKNSHKVYFTKYTFDVKMISGLFVFFSDLFQSFPDNRLNISLRSVDKLAKGKVFGFNLIDAKVFHQIDVADDAGLDELGRVDVEGEDPLEVACEDQRPHIAVGVGVKFPKALEAR